MQVGMIDQVDFGVQVIIFSKEKSLNTYPGSQISLAWLPSIVLIIFNVPLFENSILIESFEYKYFKCAKVKLKLGSPQLTTKTETIIILTI